MAKNRDSSPGGEVYPAHRFTGMYGVALHEEVLDEQLKAATDPTERRRIFAYLVHRHGEALIVEARRLALTLGFDSTAAGDAAMSESFIRLAKGLSEPWPRDKTFLERIRSEIWTELRHRRAKMAKLRVRFPAITDDVDPATTAADPERQYRSAEHLARIFQCVDQGSRTPQQERLVEAWRLNKLGFQWVEVREAVEWPGSSTSLRVSVSRFFKRLKPRIQAVS